MTTLRQGRNPDRPVGGVSWDIDLYFGGVTPWRGSDFVSSGELNLVTSPKP